MVVRSQTEVREILNEPLPARLHEFGVDQLFRDYLQQWIHASNVPLVVPN